MAKTESKLWHLEQINIFKDFTPEELKEIDEKSILHQFNKKTPIYFPEDPANVVYLLKSGRVKIVSFSDSDQEMIKTIIYPGEIFGELSLTQGNANRKDYALALDKEVKFCTIDKQEMLEILERIPRLQMRITKIIGERVLEIERRFESLIFSTSEERVVNFLLYLSEKIGQKVGDEMMLKHNLSHEEISKIICTSRQTVTTTLNMLKKKDLIYMERNKILIRDIDQLKKL